MKIQCQHVCHVDLKTHFTSGTCSYSFDHFYHHLKHWIFNKSFCMHLASSAAIKLAAREKETERKHRPRYAAHFQTENPGFDEAD